MKKILYCTLYLHCYFNLQSSQDEWIIVPDITILQRIKNNARAYALERLCIPYNNIQQAANNEVCARKFRNLFDEIKTIKTNNPDLLIITEDILGFSVTNKNEITAKNIADLTKKLVPLEDKI